MMVACFIALIVLAILSIFSAKYRQLTKEAFDCVTRRMTLRPCKTGFDEKIRASVTAKLMSRPRLSRFVYNHFEAISWFFTITLILSIFYTALTIFNITAYGTCSPSLPGACELTGKVCT